MDIKKKKNEPELAVELPVEKVTVKCVSSCGQNGVLNWEKEVLLDGEIVTMTRLELEQLKASCSWSFKEVK